jgi:hypothetical protein
MKAYLCSQFARQEEMRGYRRYLELIGWEVVSTWIDEEEDCSNKSKDYAKTDLKDLEIANVIIAFTGPPYYGTLEEIARGARHAEFGYALAKEKLIILIGNKENIFHHLDKVNQYDTWEDFLKVAENITQ